MIRTLAGASGGYTRGRLYLAQGVGGGLPLVVTDLDGRLQTRVTAVTDVSDVVLSDDGRTLYAAQGFRSSADTLAAASGQVACSSGRPPTRHRRSTPKGRTTSRSSTPAPAGPACSSPAIPGFHRSRRTSSTSPAPRRRSSAGATTPAAICRTTRSARTAPKLWRAWAARTRSPRPRTAGRRSSSGAARWTPGHVQQDVRAPPRQHHVHRPLPGLRQLVLGRLRHRDPDPLSLPPATLSGRGSRYVVVRPSSLRCRGRRR
jgi:hypothetical protein